jgi:hypothetical protein
LLSLDDDLSASLSSVDLRLAEINVRIDAPQAVLSVLDATLAFAPRLRADSPTDVVISVRSTGDVWEIRGGDGSLKVLGAQSALPQVAGATVSSAVSDVASRLRCKAMRSSVIEKDGRALALIGDDWESAITLAAHLHSRGWRFVGSDSVIFSAGTSMVYSIPKSLYVNSSSVSQLPMEYRRAVEASPWYVTAQGISFYAVDPRAAGHAETWAASSKLHGVVVVDGSMEDQASLESVDDLDLKSERFARLGINWLQIPVASLCIGGFVDTTDLVEHWFDSIAV